MAATSVRSSAIWWMLTKERQAWCNLQVKLYVIHIWALWEYACVLKWRYNTLPFLPFPLIKDVKGHWSVMWCWLIPRDLWYRRRSWWPQHQGRRQGRWRLSWWRRAAAVSVCPGSMCSSRARETPRTDPSLRGFYEFKTARSSAVFVERRWKSFATSCASTNGSSCSVQTFKLDVARPKLAHTTTNLYSYMTISKEKYSHTANSAEEEKHQQTTQTSSNSKLKRNMKGTSWFTQIVQQ